MDIAKTLRIQPGVYVAAISGGVDSMVLLDLLAKLKSAEQRHKFIIAHFDHGIRNDSARDCRLVATEAAKHGLPFVYAEGNLGYETSEAAARKARYEFLEKVKHQASAEAIITAHHLDDALETAVHNILRGTGRRGISSLQARQGIVRPFLHLPKEQLIKHAKENGVVWREDSTNRSLKFKRNYIRQAILPSIKAKHPEKYEELKKRVKRQCEINRAIDNSLNVILHIQPHNSVIRRNDVTMLPHKVAREVVAHWLRNNGARDFNRPIIERLTIMLKAAKPRTIMVINRDFSVKFDAKNAQLVTDKVAQEQGSLYNI